MKYQISNKPQKLNIMLLTNQLQAQINQIAKDNNTEARVNLEQKKVFFSFDENITDKYNEEIENPIAIEIQDQMMELGFDGALFQDEVHEIAYDCLCFEFYTVTEEDLEEFFSKEVKNVTDDGGHRTHHAVYVNKETGKIFEVVAPSNNYALQEDCIKIYQNSDDRQYDAEESNSTYNFLECNEFEQEWIETTLPTEWSEMDNLEKTEWLIENEKGWCNDSFEIEWTETYLPSIMEYAKKKLEENDIIIVE